MSTPSLAILLLLVVAGCQTGPSEWDKFNKREAEYHMSVTNSLAAHRQLVPAPLRETVQEKLARYREEAKVAAQKRRDDYIAAHPDLPWEVKTSIEKGMIFIGMESEPVEASIGKPERINETVGKYGRHEQWCYPNSTYIFFEYGRITSWHMRR